MKKIPSDFTCTKYGLTVRLVREEDAPFILELRTNKKLSRYLHKTEDNLNKQIAWIREYKEREKRGEDYYFIYFSGDKPIGVNRIYDITENTSTGGSWICREDSSLEESLATYFLNSDIYELFEIVCGPYTISKGNKQVLKFHKNMGAEIISENSEEYLVRINSDKFSKAKERYIKLLGLV